MEEWKEKNKKELDQLNGGGNDAEMQKYRYATLRVHRLGMCASRIALVRAEYY
jgi:hypothetical protein